MPRHHHITLLTSALTLAACGVDTAAPDATLLDAGNDAQGTTGDDAAAGDASQVHEGDASSSGDDAEVTKRSCNDACSGATPYCDEASDSCVACLDSSHCAGDPSAPRCEQGACVPCETNEHCSGVTSGAMALGVCDQGSCVECTPGDAQACLVSGTQYVCNPQQRTCDLNRKAHSKTTCNACVGAKDEDCNARPDCISDAECQAGQACVELPAGGGIAVCLQVATEAVCPRPYIRKTPDPVTTADGDSVRICTFRTETTCQAHADYSNKRCGTPKSGAEDVDELNTGDNSLCGVQELNDGFCVFYEDVQQYLCTVPCANDAMDCPFSAVCEFHGAYHRNAKPLFVVTQRRFVPTTNNAP